MEKYEHLNTESKAIRLKYLDSSLCATNAISFSAAGGGGGCYNKFITLNVGNYLCDTLFFPNLEADKSEMGIWATTKLLLHMKGHSIKSFD